MSIFIPSRPVYALCVLELLLTAAADTRLIRWTLHFTGVSTIMKGWYRCGISQLYGDWVWPAITIPDLW